MEVQAFNQDPVIVGGQKIDEEQHCHLAADLITKLFIPDYLCACVLTHYVITVLHTNYSHTTSSTKR